MAEATALATARLFSRISDPARESVAHRIAADARLVRGDVAGARTCVDAAMKSAERRGNRLVYGEALFTFARTLLAAGDRVNALLRGLDARGALETVGAKRAVAQVNSWLAGTGLPASPGSRSRGVRRAGAS